MPLSAPLHETLRTLETHRERFWSRNPGTADPRLRWRANAVRHALHVLPSHRVLEVGAGGGIWTEHLGRAFRGETSIVAATANPELARKARDRALPSTRVVGLEALHEEYGREAFDFVVGTGILCHHRYAEQLAWMLELLRPGGQILFFEANFWNPQGFVKSAVPGAGRLADQSPEQTALRAAAVRGAATRAGFADVSITPFETLHARTPEALVPAMQAMGVVADAMPLVRRWCGTLSIWANKPGVAAAHAVDMTPHTALHGAVSVVVPCYNERANVETLVRTFDRHYSRYVHEYVIVNDASTDDTSAVAHQLATEIPAVRVIDRTPPRGVGRALRDGLAAATGRYVLTLDADFALIIPELRDVFDAAAEGADVVIGSRFSRDSLLVNYPFGKIVANRGFHALLRLVLGVPLRDLSNNLKLFRREVLADVEIREPHFAANAETGLAPLMAGWRVREVPVSWIDRTPAMGTSSFKLPAVAPGYLRVLLRAARSKAARR